MIRKTALAAAFLAAVIASRPAPAAQLKLKVTPQADGANVPVCAKIDLPAELKKLPGEKIMVILRQAGGRSAAGQVVHTDGGAELWWILPKAKANKSTTWTVELTAVKFKRVEFKVDLKDEAGKHLDVLWAGKAVTRYMYARDTSTKQRAHETYKVYNHVFDEAGKEVITKGPGGLYTHHRGIFIGWNRLGFAGKRYDFWGMGGTTQEHQKLLRQTAGPVLARYRARVHWNITGPKTILSEERQITVFRQPAPTIMLMDFRTLLTAAAGEVMLDGDPEHAGCQYRPHNDLAEAGKKGGPATKGGAKYLFHREGIDPRKDRDLPWVAMSYALGGKAYNVQHMSHPGIPKGNTYSAYRPYGRFGACFKQKIPEGQTLELRYRFRVGAGQMPTRAEMAARYAAFARPPRVQAIK